MPLPAGGNLPPISIAELNAEFGYGNNLAAYRGKLVGIGSACKVISSGAVNISDFYSTNKVAAGAPTARNGEFTVPQYKTMTFNVQGGQAGFAGAAGVYSGGPANGFATAPSNGGAGGGTYFDTIVGANGGAPNGGAGDIATVTLTNPLLGGTGPTSGAAQGCTVGGGGGGGQGGPIYGWNGVGYVFAGYAATGANGAAGSASTSWTGEP
jgi:hypothetical protein